MIGGGARNRNRMVTQRIDSDLDRSRPFDRCNNLRHVSLVDSIEYELHSRGVPARLI